MGYKIRQLTEGEFPASLLEIPQPPKALWIAGAPLEPDTVYLTVVGSRKYTAYGKEACEAIIAGLSGYDITIVSGLAIGMDTLAHEAAMAAGLRTIAVPGSGLDQKILYPRQNVRLAERIVEEGGTLLSEFEPDFKATLYGFPMRNRIMAGLAQATLIVEANEKSGTLITARLATDYNRDVLAIPGSMFSQNAKGTNKLIALGATPVTSPSDVLLALGFSIEDMAEKVEIDLSQFPDRERAVLELLGEPMPRETIFAELQMSASEANVLLMKLEIAGHILDTPQGIRRNYI